MHFAPPSLLLRAAVGYFPASFFALRPRLTDRSRRKLLHTLQSSSIIINNFIATAAAAIIIISLINTADKQGRF